MTIPTSTQNGILKKSSREQLKNIELAEKISKIIDQLLPKLKTNALNIMLIDATKQPTNDKNFIDMMKDLEQKITLELGPKRRNLSLCDYKVDSNAFQYNEVIYVLLYSKEQMDRLNRDDSLNSKRRVWATHTLINSIIVLEYMRRKLILPENKYLGTSKMTDDSKTLEYILEATEEASGIRDIIWPLHELLIESNNQLLMQNKTLSDMTNTDILQASVMQSFETLQETKPIAQNDEPVCGIFSMFSAYKTAANTAQLNNTATNTDNQERKCEFPRSICVIM